ncbi:MAG: serine acetyltransferase [Bacteroidales bacterium]|nr:serine acetyltransferase [Bacteroidales bacterium]
MPNAVKIYYVAHWFYQNKMVFISLALEALIFLIYNSRIPSSCLIGKDSYCGYGGIGVVIHRHAVIGNNVVIGQNTTIGGRAGYSGVPKIGNNVYIGVGARILGPIRIGDNAVIGANAVVIHDVPSNTIVAGVPARIIRKIKE